MKLRAFITAAFCSIVVSSFPGPAEADGPASAAGKPSSLVERYRLALKVDPDNPKLHYSLGTALLFDGRNPESIAEFRRAYSALGDSAEVNYQLGLACSRSGDLYGALLYLGRAEALGPLERPELFDLANAYYDLGLACLESDAFDDAARLFSKTLSLDPERQEIRRQLGEVYAREGRIEQALAEFEAYLKVYPDDPMTREDVYTLYFNRAMESLEKRNLQGARDDFSKALCANPGSPLAIYYLGFLDHSEGDYEGAAVRLATIYPVSPPEIRQSMVSLLRSSARALLELKQPRKALVAVAPLVDMQPADLQDLYAAGQIHLTLEEFDAARICFEKVLALEPSHEGATAGIAASRAGAVEELLASGRTLFQQGEYREALRKDEAALAIHPQDAGALACAAQARLKIKDKAAAHFTLGEEALRQSDPRRALKLVGKGLGLEPDSRRGADLRERILRTMAREMTEALQRGARLAEEGRLKEADSAYAAILDLDPADAEAREGRARLARLLEKKAAESASRGNVALEEGKLAEAREAFDAALSLVPELGEARDGLARVEALTAAMASEEVQWGRRARSAGRLQQARKHFAGALRLREDSDIRGELEAVDRSLDDRRRTLLDAARESLEKADFRRARDYFRRVLAGYPQHPSALEGLKKTEARISAAVEKEIAIVRKDIAELRFQRVLARCRLILEVDPSNREALEGVVRARKEMEGDLGFLIASGNEDLAGGFLEEAEMAFREALALDPFHREALEGLHRLEKLRSLVPDKTRTQASADAG